MAGADLDSAWITLMEARRYNAVKNRQIGEDRLNGEGRRGSLTNEETLSGKLTAIARSSELKLRCLQNELAEAGSGTGAVDGGLYAYGPPVWESYKSLTKVPKIFKTLHKNDAVEDSSASACFQGSHKSPADIMLSKLVEGTPRYDGESDEPRREVGNCTFCIFCKTPEEHWQHFRRKHRSVIHSAEITQVAQRIASARSIYNRWSRPKRYQGDQKRNQETGLNAEESDEEMPTGNNRYKILVKSGKPGTNMGVRIKLFGENKSSHFARLRNGPSSRQFHFYSDTTETFFIRSEELGDIKSCLLKIKGQPVKQWFLKEIVVVDLESNKAWAFSVQQLLGNENLEGEKQMAVMTYEIDPRVHAITQAYDITVVTGNVNFSGTDANVYVTLFGKKGVSEKLHLIQTNVTNRKPFKSGQTDTFTVSAHYVGEMSKIRIEHDNRGMGPGWFLDKVIVKELSRTGTSRSWLFKCNQWIADDEGDRQIFKELAAVPQQPIQAAQKSEVDPHKRAIVDEMSIYEVTIDTGASSFKGQNVNVYVQVFGTKGKSSEMWFAVGDSGRFDKECSDKICLETNNVGSIKEIRIGHDHVGYGSGWLLESMQVKKFFTNEEVREFRRNIFCQLRSGDRHSSQYNDIETDLYDDAEESMGFQDPDKYLEFKAKRLELASKRQPVYEEYRFDCGQWLAIDDDGSGSKCEVTLKPKSSVIMFKDMSQKALEVEKQAFEANPRICGSDRPPSSRRPPKRTPSSRENRKETKATTIQRRPGKFKLVESVPLERPRSSSQPRISKQSGYYSGQGKSVNFDPSSDVPPIHLRPKTATLIRGGSRSHSQRPTLYSDEDGDYEEEDRYGMSSASNSRDGRPFSPASNHATPPFIHVKARTPVYATYNGKQIIRASFPDELVPWNVPYPQYNPTDWTKPDMMGNWVDPDIRVERNFKLKFNVNDGKVNRKSNMGEYRLTEGSNGVPLNPMGRTGMRGRGRLGRWGPNHAGDPIVTRWKRNERNVIQYHPRTGKPIIQFVSIQRKDTGEWAIPGGMVDAGEDVSSTLKREFVEEALASMGTLDGHQKMSISRLVDKFFQPTNGREIFRGYVDDPRNTDNAWMETVAVLYHDEAGTSVGKLPLVAGDDAGAVQWADVGGDMKLYATHQSFLHKVAVVFDAHW